MVRKRRTSQAGVKRFPDSYWDSYLHGFVYLKDFFEEDWEAKIRLPRPGDPRREIPAVRRLRRKGAELREDIVSQDSADGFFGAFTNRLMFSEASHPRTYESMWIDVVVSYPVLMYYKAKHNRARPVQYDPSLAPIINTPGHPAYPSGHSTQAHLIAHSLGWIVPSAAEVLRSLADTIAKNREIAGVHYPSDSRAGVSLARQMFGIMMTRPAYRRLLAAARGEW